MAKHLAYVIATDNEHQRVTTDEIEHCCSTAPHFEGRRAPGLRCGMSVVHEIPTLFSDVTRGKLEVYAGRSTVSNVHGRMCAHASNRGHEYGVIAFTCPGSQVIEFEDFFIKILHRLQENNMVCVANLAKHGGGGEPRPRDAGVVYLTWKEVRERHVARATKAVIRDIAQDLATIDKGYGGSVTASQMETAIARLSSPSTREHEHDLSWLPRYNGPPDNI